MSFTLTPEDWIKANRLWLARPAGWLRWRRPLGFAILGVCVLVVALDLLVLDRTLGEAGNDVVLTFVLAAVLMALPAISGLFIPAQVRRQFRQRPAMGDPMRYRWDEASIEGITRTGSTIQPWTELHRQLRDKDSFVFLMTDRMMLLVPRRALTAEQACDLAATADRFGPPIG